MVVLIELQPPLIIYVLLFSVKHSQAQIRPAESIPDGQERGNVLKRGEELGPGTGSTQQLSVVH